VQTRSRVLLTPHVLAYDCFIWYTSVSIPFLGMGLQTDAIVTASRIGHAQICTGCFGGHVFPADPPIDSK